MLCPSPPYLLGRPEITEACVAEQIVLKSPLDLKATTCPVNPDNSRAWTARERALAAKARVAESLADLWAMVRSLRCLFCFFLRLG
jgi:hypothetical protein